MKYTLSIILALGVLGIGWITYVGITTQPTVMVQDEQENTLINTQTTDNIVGVEFIGGGEQTDIGEKGIYTVFSEEALAQAEGKTVLFFHATWCPSCNAADKKLSVEQIPDGLTILKTDFDTQLDLRKKYGVLAQHTFVQIDTNGDKLSSWFGGRDVEDILSQLK